MSLCLRLLFLIVVCLAGLSPVAAASSTGTIFFTSERSSETVKMIIQGGLIRFEVCPYQQMTGCAPIAKGASIEIRKLMDNLMKEKPTRRERLLSGAFYASWGFVAGGGLLLAIAVVDVGGFMLTGGYYGAPSGGPGKLATLCIVGIPTAIAAYAGYRDGGNPNHPACYRDLFAAIWDFEQSGQDKIMSIGSVDIQKLVAYLNLKLPMWSAASK